MTDKRQRVMEVMGKMSLTVKIGYERMVEPRK